MSNQAPKAARLSKWWTVEFPDGEVIDLSTDHFNSLAAAIMSEVCTGCPRLGDTPPAKVTARRGTR